MRFFLVFLQGLVVSASPLISRGTEEFKDTDVANDMAKLRQTVHKSKGKDSPATFHSELGVIFARGTFDSGDMDKGPIGKFVGNAFFHQLITTLTGAVQRKDIAFQGVGEASEIKTENKKVVSNSEWQYPATLKQYLEEGGGSDEGAQILAHMVNEYHEDAPKAKIVISGWSQGAMVVHKAWPKISAEARQQVVAVITFGDPYDQWKEEGGVPKEAVPESLFLSICIGDSTSAFRSTPKRKDLPEDPLCSKKSLLPDAETFSRVKNLFEDLEEKYPQYKEPAAAAGKKFLAQFTGAMPRLVEQLLKAKLRRVFLTPEHFLYGEKVYVERAAEYVKEKLAAKKS